MDGDTVTNCELRLTGELACHRYPSHLFVKSYAFPLDDGAG